MLKWGKLNYTDFAQNCILDQKERIILWVRKNTVYYTRIQMHNTGPWVMWLCMIWGWIKSAKSCQQRSGSRTTSKTWWRICMQIRRWHSTAAIFSRMSFNRKKCVMILWKYSSASAFWGSTVALTGNMMRVPASGICCIGWTSLMIISSVWMRFIHVWQLRTFIPQAFWV